MSQLHTSYKLQRNLKGKSYAGTSQKSHYSCRKYGGIRPRFILFQLRIFRKSAQVRSDRVRSNIKFQFPNALETCGAFPNEYTLWLSLSHCGYQSHIIMHTIAFCEQWGGRGIKLFHLVTGGVFNQRAKWVNGLRNISIFLRMKA